MAHPAAHARQDVVGRRDADVGGDQDLLEALERVVVDWLVEALRAIGPANDVVETVDELLFGPREAVSEAADEAHGGVRVAAGEHAGSATAWRWDTGRTRNCDSEARAAQSRRPRTVGPPARLYGSRSCR